MYEHFYGFNERPFTLLPDPDFLFLGEKTRVALDLLETEISSQSGFCIISGEIGAGKTTLIRALLNRLDDSINVGLVSYTHPSFGELLQWVMAAYSLPCDTDDPFELHTQFVDYALQQYAQNRHTLLIIDEAQNLSPLALEELRMLSIANSDRKRVLQIVLVGQQRLRDRLQQPDMAKFAQGIAFYYHLQGLTEEETCRYIRHRLRHAGGKEDLFDDAACRIVHYSSGGIPRLINRICGLGLEYGCTQQSPCIDAVLLKRVIENQHMGALQDISSMNTAKSGQTIVSLEETDAQGRPLNSDTIVGAMSHALFRTAPDVQLAGGLAGGSPEADSSSLQALIVAAERRGRMRSERVFLGLLLGVAVLTGGTGWLMRDTWNGGMDVNSGAQAQQVLLPVDAGKQEQVLAAERAAEVKVVAQQQEAERLVAEQAAVERAAEQEAALQQETEQLARIRAEARRLAREQRVAEQRLVIQRADRKALEHEADVERGKIESARKAIEAIDIQRERVRARQAAVANFDAGPSAYAEDDGDAIIQEMMQEEVAAREIPPASFAVLESSADGTREIAPASFAVTAPPAYDEDDGDAILQEMMQEAGKR